MNNSIVQLRKLLEDRLYHKDVHKLIQYSLKDEQVLKHLFQLIKDPNVQVAYQATWVLSHWPKVEQGWLIQQQGAFMDYLLLCTQDGQIRLLLSILNQQPLIEKDRLDVLDYCMETMLAQSRPVAIRSFCIKMIYKYCLQYPELLPEFRTALEMISGDTAAAIQSVYKHMSKQIQGHRRQGIQ